MDSQLFVRRMEAHAGAFEGLFRDVGEEEALWKPDPGVWSLLEIANHLYDEEREDFRRRLDLTLHHPEDPWPGIDPESWVLERNYAGRDFRESVTNFLNERDRSLEWLRGLRAPAWENVHRHPVLGELRAGDLMASWLSHDLLHIRQIARLHFLYLEEQTRPFSSRYAGRW